MIRYRDFENGEGIRVYRSVDEIRADIRRVSHKVNEIYGMLNIRDMLVDMIIEYSEESPERWIGALEGVLSEAESLLSHVKLLEETLGELSAELDEAKCAMTV